MNFASNADLPRLIYICWIIKDFSATCNCGTSDHTIMEARSFNFHTAAHTAATDDATIVLLATLVFS